MSGRIALIGAADALHGEPKGASQLDELTVAPALAPWIGARVGLPHENEAGLGYTGRALRLDGRHAFTFGDLTLSLGLGASAVAPLRPGEGSEGSRVYGGGLDLPVLLGVRSANDLYAFWIGPRAGVELLSGRVPSPDGSPTLADLRGSHVHAGLVVGVRVGFRHVHAALELSAAYHHAAGTLGGVELGLDQVSLTPGGALLLSF